MTKYKEEESNNQSLVVRVIGITAGMQVYEETHTELLLWKPRWRLCLSLTQEHPHNSEVSP